MLNIAGMSIAVWHYDGAIDVDVHPDGCMDLIWSNGEVHIAGPDRHSVRAHISPGTLVMGWRFPPGALSHCLGIPARELSGARIPAANALGSTLAAPLRISSPEEAHRVWTNWVRSAVERRGTVPARVVEAVRLIDAGIPISQVATTLGYSTRQLHRHSETSFGYGPRTLGRILRFQRALSAARSGLSSTDAVAVAGYSDQSHLIRDTRTLTSRSFGELCKEFR